MKRREVWIKLQDLTYEQVEASVVQKMFRDGLSPVFRLEQPTEMKDDKQTVSSPDTGSVAEGIPSVSKDAKGTA